MDLSRRSWKLLTVGALIVGAALVLSPNPHLDRAPSILLMVPLGALFLLPAVLAGFRNHDRFWLILVLTIGLGWTVVAWIFALAWAWRSPLPRSAS